MEYSKNELIDKQAKVVGECIRGKISKEECSQRLDNLDKSYHIYDMMPSVKGV